MSQEQTESWETTVYDIVYSCYSKKKTMFIGELIIASITKQISRKEPTVKLPICQKYVLRFTGKWAVTFISDLQIHLKEWWKYSREQRFAKNTTLITSIRHYELLFHYYHYHKALNMTICKCDFLSQWHRINWPS